MLKRKKHHSQEEAFDPATRFNLCLNTALDAYKQKKTNLFLKHINTIQVCLIGIQSGLQASVQYIDLDHAAKIAMLLKKTERQLKLMTDTYDGFDKELSIDAMLKLSRAILSLKDSSERPIIEDIEALKKITPYRYISKAKKPSINDIHALFVNNIFHDERYPSVFSGALRGKSFSSESKHSTRKFMMTEILPTLIPLLFDKEGDIKSNIARDINMMLAGRIEVQRLKVKKEFLKAALFQTCGVYLSNQQHRHPTNSKYATSVVVFRQAIKHLTCGASDDNFKQLLKTFCPNMSEKAPEKPTHKVPPLNLSSSLDEETSSSSYSPHTQEVRYNKLLRFSSGKTKTLVKNKQQRDKKGAVTKSLSSRDLKTLQRANTQDASPATKLTGSSSSDNLRDKIRRSLSPRNKHAV
mgnify:CR=1 FL=1